MDDNTLVICEYANVCGDGRVNCGHCRVHQHYFGCIAARCNDAAKLVKCREATTEEKVLYRMTR